MSTPSLRACLLSGGSSRRMGRDKALLPHPEGGSWLERTLRLLAQLRAPLTLLSRHPTHLELGEAMGPGLHAAACSGLTCVSEPPPWEGPLLALRGLMELHPGERLLLCPVDMPCLTLPPLQLLVQAAAEQPTLIHLAHDGQRRQPLLGVYPGDTEIRMALSEAIDTGERRLERWLAAQPCLDVHLQPTALHNINRPEDLERAMGNGDAGSQDARGKG